MLNIIAEFDIEFSARTLIAIEKREAANKKVVCPTEAVDVADHFDWLRKLVRGYARKHNK